MRLHADDAQVEDMLPDRWAKQHPEAVLQHRLSGRDTDVGVAYGVADLSY